MRDASSLNADSSADSNTSDAQTTALWIGRLSARDCVRAVLSVSRTVSAWHENDQLHRSIRIESLTWLREADIPELCPPSSEPIEFGGPVVDPDQCPPELRSSKSVVVPMSLDSARNRLAAQSLFMPPERIDVYQLGTLLCRLVTGQSIRSYLSSPATMSRVPKPIRNVIDRCVGYDESNRIDSVLGLIELLTATIDERSLSGDAATNLPRDTDVVAVGETRVRKRIPAFQQLGHFEVLEEIGHGGMGVVYRGYDRSLDRTVALKVLHPRFSNDPAFVKRFKAEAAAAAKLSHPHLVPIYFIGEDSGRHFYAMQFIDGESLAERLHRVGRLARDEVLAIMQQVLLGLAAAHRQGFVHRDIKPGNIILDHQNGSALLTDFGLARGPVPDEPADINYVMGTAEYMSPEQAQGESVDARSDLYSVGVLLYQLLSGRTPFDANTPSSQLIHHVCEQPQPLALVAPEVEPQLVRVVERLLKKRPQERYQSVEDLLIELQQLPGQLPQTTSAMPVSRFYPPTQPSPRRFTAQRLAGIGGVVALAMALWFARPHQKVSGFSVSLSPHADPVWSLAFSPDGKLVVSGGGHSASLKDAGDTSLRIWDAASGRMLKQSERLPIGSERLVVTEDSKRVIALGAAREDTSTTVVWDLETGHQAAPNFDDPFAFHFDAARLNAQALIAAGNRGLVELSLSGGSDHAVRKRVLKQWPSPIRAVCVSRDSTGPIVFASTEQAGEPIVVQFAGRGLRERSQFDGFGGPIIALESTPNGQTLITRSTELKDSAAVGDWLHAWHVSSRKLLWTRGPFAPVNRTLSLSRDGRRLITIAESVALHDGEQAGVAQSAVVFDVESGREICRVQTGSPQLHAAAISPDGSLAVIGDAAGRVVFSHLPK